MGRLVPYLSVKSAVEALDLYEKIFGATVKERLPVEEGQAADFGLSDDVDLSKTTMHGAFEIQGELLYISDNFSGKVLESSNVSILVEPDNLEKMKEFYENAKKLGCNVTMELEQQFWGDYFTSFVDPFGISWQMNFSPQQQDE